MKCKNKVLHKNVLFVIKYVMLSLNFQPLSVSLSGRGGAALVGERLFALRERSH